MPALRPEEQWAAEMVSAALSVPVTQHDDGTRDGMHDLDIHLPDGTMAAMEVTAAADAESIELWNLVNGKTERWIEPALRQGWMVTLQSSARAKRVMSELPVVLAELEASGVSEYRTAWTGRGLGDPWARHLLDLGVTDLRGGPTDYPGVIYLTIELEPERSGGMVDVESKEVPAWVTTFLASDELRDVRSKLARSGAEQRHAFVIMPGFSTAPFCVTDMLWRDDGVPPTPPSLPPEITHVWLVGTWNIGTGVRWSPMGGWQRFVRI
jgi:hypothetical protein